MQLQPLDPARCGVEPLELTSLPCVIGRSRGCHLRLNLDRISRRHLELRRDGDQLLVEDLGSTNGTFVNNERIRIPTLLKPGDTLHIADYAFRLVESGAPQASGTRRAGRRETLAGQTIVGFTEDPTGFPVQAPQFYELLNESLIIAQAIPATGQGDGSDVLVVTGRSRHPTLEADHEKLASMARQLGEEARYHGLLRRAALEMARESGIEQPILALPVDPVEIEDVQLLLAELQDFTRQFRRQRIALLVRLPGLDARTIEQLQDCLDDCGVRMAVLESDAEALGQALPDDRALLRLALPADQGPSPIDEFF